MSSFDHGSLGSLEASILCEGCYEIQVKAASLCETFGRGEKTLVIVFVCLFVVFVLLLLFFSYSNITKFDSTIE